MENQVIWENSEFTPDDFAKLAGIELNWHPGPYPQFYDQQGNVIGYAWGNDQQGWNFCFSQECSFSSQLPV